MMARSTSFLSGGGDRQVATWIAGITAAAAIGYVVLGSYLPSFKWTRKMDKDAVPGLYNRYGNDCFANCVIQVCHRELRLTVELGGDTVIPGVLEGTGR
jgi:hypothetical protein